MKKKILALIFVLIIVFSVALTYNVYKGEMEKKDETDYSGEATSDDIIDEMDESLLGEDDEVEIGEMV